MEFISDIKENRFTLPYCRNRTLQINREGVIFYTKGNNQNLDKAKRKIVNYSIRNVVIKDIYLDKNLDLVNFYLEINDLRIVSHMKIRQKNFFHLMALYLKSMFQMETIMPGMKEYQF